MIADDELRTLVDRLPTGVVAVNQQLVVEYANISALRMFQPETLRPTKKLPPAPFDPELESFVRELFGRETGNTVRAVQTEERSYSLLGVPSHGRRLAILFIDDVSDRARRERARTRFVANAAHELLTPLTGIASAAHVLEAGAKEVPEMRDRFLHHIARECGRLTRISRGLLVLARAQSGQEPPSLDVVELRPLLEDVLEATPEGATQIVCGEHIRVFADRDLVETALSNLVANAIRHSRDGRVSLTVDENGGTKVDVVITNAGVGGDVDRFHERFSTGGGRDGGGFGLGVSIASDALAVVGGKLSFEFDGDRTYTLVELPSA